MRGRITRLDADGNPTGESLDVDVTSISTVMTWKLLKSKRETPCCKQPVRVTLVEPGVQYRRCNLCKRTNAFVLEQMTKLPDTLRMRWLSDDDLESTDD